MNAAEESLDEDPDDNAIAFMNFNCAALIKDGSGSTIIINTSVNSHDTSQEFIEELSKLPCAKIYPCNQ